MVEVLDVAGRRRAIRYAFPGPERRPLGIRSLLARVGQVSGRVKPDGVRTRSREHCLAQTTAILFLALLFGAGLPGCDGEPVVPPACHEVDGEIWVVMTEGVRADSAERALSSLEVEFDSEALQDCFTLYFNVASGDPRDHLSDLQAATQA